MILRSIYGENNLRLQSKQCTSARGSFELVTETGLYYLVCQLGTQQTWQRKQQQKTKPISLIFSLNVSTSFLILLKNNKLKHEGIVLAYFLIGLMKKFLQRREKGNWRSAKACHLCFEKKRGAPRLLVVVAP